jgi:hypothetical protein
MERFNDFLKKNNLASSSKEESLADIVPSKEESSADTVPSN